jgi:outer membrane protein assembly factor BamB
VRHLTSSVRGCAFALLALVCPFTPTAGAQDWPSFRGPDATGTAETAIPPIAWDVAAGRNVAWTVPIPGLGHSSPIVFGQRVFVTTAVPLAGSAAGESGVALRGESPLRGLVPHAWRIYCIDRRTGRINWERTAYEGVPRVKRHAKASQASATPATDGTHVIAMMGSEGLYAYDMDGRLLWKRDLGSLNAGYAHDPNEQWGPASSPVIHDGLVIVQNDRFSDSYVAAFDIRTGEQRWHVGRDELPSWSTPVLHRGARATMVTSSPKQIRGIDPKTGREIWRVPDGTEVKVPTPVIAGDLVIVTGGYPTGGRPILGLRAASGEVVWRLERGSPYTPTPLVYGDILYVCIDNGVLSAYEVRTGKRLYQRRIAPDVGGVSASPVAAAGRLYIASEDGALFVIRAGRTFELLARNDMRELCLATPALSDDLLLVRTRTHLYALRDAATKSTSQRSAAK